MTNTNIISNIAIRMRESVSFKLTTIGFLILLLLIPGEMIRSLIREREMMNQAAVKEVSSLWATKQLINGPILSVPVRFEKAESTDKIKEYTQYWHILPRTLQVTGQVDPEKLKRGIYEIVVYETAMDITGSFEIGEQPQDKYIVEILWDQAFLTVGISDLRGIKDELDISINGKPHPVKSGTKIPSLSNSGVTVPYPIDRGIPKFDFAFHLSMQGSSNLSFTPIGSTTEVNLTSSWPSPSFNGHFLPDYREVREDGFTANWKVLQLNRNFPEQWLSTIHNQSLSETAFGMDLMLPLDDYQKSMRSAKYAVMTISLTFLLFFLVELLNKRRIHPFQYALVGLALSLFYILLISISEHMDFNIAYGISTLAISVMITLYSLSIFKARKVTYLLSAVLLTVYGFVFVTLQLTDFALLLGSIGLTLTLGATMYFTRNINWYTAQDNSTVTA